MAIQLNRKPDWSRTRKALLRQGEPDCVPHLELGVHPVHKASVIGRPCVTVADEIEFARRAGYDFIKLQPAINMNPGNVMPKGGAHIVSLGEAVGQRRWADEHDGVIATMEDFERYVWPKADDVSYARLEEANRTLPDDMGIIGQYGDIYTFVWESMGFETFAMALYEDPDVVQSLFDKVGAIICDLFEKMVTFERVTALWYSDDLAYTGGPMIDPDFYRQYLFPWVRRMGDLAKERDIPFLYHSDGVLWDVMEDLIACGVTSLHPIEPKSMDIAEVKQRYGDRLAVVGSVEVDTLSRGTPEQVEQEVRSLMERVAPGGGYALGSSNSVPDYAKFDNYIAMLRAGEKYGNYPISL
jgi:uroporphyrinogen decarboxylase